MNIFKPNTAWWFCYFVAGLFYFFTWAQIKEFQKNGYVVLRNSKVPETAQVFEGKSAKAPIFFTFCIGSMGIYFAAKTHIYNWKKK